MRAARYHAPGDVRVEEIPEPEPGPGEVKLRVSANGMCGSDLHEYFATQMMVPAEPHPTTGAQAPVVLGHEFAGTVCELGGGVAGIELGDRVAVRPTIACGRCSACLAGLPNVCQLIAFHGLSAPTGGLAEFTTVDARAAHRLPDDVDLEHGALVEPMAVAYHAAQLGNLGAGDTAVICGLGPIGIGIWLALRAAGISDLILSDPSEHRRRIVSSLGAENVIDPTETDVREVSLEVSHGAGARAAFDAAGVGASVDQGLSALAPRGRLVVVGLHEQPMPFMPTTIVLQEFEMVGSGTYFDSDFQAVIASMARGDYPTDGWVEHAPLDDVTDVLQRLRDGRAVKVLVDA